jgi:hypothetical protein
MNRTCANCCAYDAQWGCVNGIHDVDQPHICCAHHQTPAEFEADMQAIERFRVRIGLTPRRGWPGDEFTGVTP